MMSKHVELKLTSNSLILSDIKNLSTIDVQPVSSDHRYSRQLNQNKKNPMISSLSYMNAKIDARIHFDNHVGNAPKKISKRAS